jgi:hypothetical protein
MGSWCAFGVDELTRLRHTGWRRSLETETLTTFGVAVSVLKEAAAGLLPGGQVSLNL